MGLIDSDQRRSENATIRRSLFSAYCGIGCLLAWITSVLCLGGIVSGTCNDGQSCYDRFFPAAVLAATITCVVLCLPPRSWTKRLGSRPALAILSCLAALCVSITLVMGLRLFTTHLACYILGAIAGCIIAVFLAQWLVLLSDFDPKAVVSALLIAIIIELIFFIVIHSFTKALNSPELATAVSVALFTASFICLMLSRHYLHPIEEPSDTQNPVLPKLVLFAFISSFVSKFLLMFAIEYNRGTFFPGTGIVSTELGSRIMTERIGCALCIVVVAGLLFVLWKTSKRAGFIVLIIYRIIVFTLVMALGFTLAQLPQFTPPFVTYTFVLLAYFLSQAGVWIIAQHAGFLLGRGTLNLIGYVLMVQFLGYFLGFCLHEVLKNALTTSPDLIVVVLSSLLAITCLTFLFIFTEREVNRISRAGITEPAEESGLNEKCELARERYLLTDRETEVLKLLARGRNAVSIQELLVISYNTVKAHRHNIYVKLNIHSQQELLTFIETLR